MAEHIVSGYDDDLNQLTTTLSELGALVEAMTSDSVKSIKKRDSELAKQVITMDKRANLLQEQIDEDALRLMALRHPMATDLRRTIGAIRSANDLERVGDLAEGIARRAISINDEDKIGLAKGVYRIGKLVKSQLSGALDALLREDADKALQVWLADEDVDEMYNAIFRELLTYMMGDPRTITACASFLFVAKNLERIGDHATNICESVYFTVHGKQLVNDESLDGLRSY
ncbi:phosphate signaling complex protein PhoU [Hellea sp.]|nr:phosphate signaling complex protein PhoU [Hellea sp.]